MGLPNDPVTLSVQQVDELSQKLSVLRHDISNNLSLMIAALELIRYKPEMVDRMMDTVSDQPTKITTALGRFSEEFDKILKISRP